MSDSIYITEDNVVINKSYAYAAKQEEIRPIDMKNKQDILDEIERLTKVRAEYNIHNISPPLHIKRENYTEVSEYKKAKDKYYNDYKTNYNLVNGNINDLQNINTALCRESKKKEDEQKIQEGTFYNADEKEAKAEMDELRAALRRATNKTYYEKNKEKILIKKKIKSLKQKIKVIGNLPKTDYVKVLVKGTKIIKPLCNCGRLCDVTKLETIKKHSNSEKHRLFKSVIALIHYRRKEGRLKVIIDKINRDFVDYKRVVRREQYGRSVTVTNKTDNNIIKLFYDCIHPIDENVTHQPREPYIERKKYTPNYKEARELYEYRINKRTQN
tara:strand:+ start:1085 stop:2068 length:984 start_codon:yes stop_codon:yes gene_type:complete